ncbi:hypothetical protein [Okeania sp. SIO2G5]|uniref:hypothetical protein n=1 Tax=Okeania sp. SIO2G5 TaxID=2607796 RepID=UPI0013C0B7F5|nr:hypothetical protein [Okeania sp. SIO2G5]NEP76336.1 hypothetical protein [Okeania sp. SIO2G5]
MDDSLIVETYGDRQVQYFASSIDELLESNQVDFKVVDRGDDDWVDDRPEPTTRKADTIPSGLNEGYQYHDFPDYVSVDEASGYY